MTTYVALLRGVNVGGRKLPMADLRATLDANGLPGARTYIQSGNIVVDTALDAVSLAALVRDLIDRDFGLDVPVMVVSADELVAIVAANPYPDQPDHRRLHAIVMRDEPDENGLAALAERVAIARAKGSTDTMTIVGRVAYLHTPGGFGVSELAKAVGVGARNPVAAGTARNWATMTTLLTMATDEH